MVNPRSASTVPLAVSKKTLWPHHTSFPLLHSRIQHLLEHRPVTVTVHLAELRPRHGGQEKVPAAVDYGACAACGEVRNCATGRRGGGGPKHRPGLCRTSLSHKPRQARPQRSLMRNILWLPHKKNECAHSLFPSLSLILFLSTTHTYTYTTFTQYKCGVSDKKGSSLSTPPTPRTHTKWKQALHEGKGYTYVLINA